MNIRFFLLEELFNLNQHGIFNGRGIETALFVSTNEMYNSLDTGNISCGIFFICHDHWVLMILRFYFKTGALWSQR